MPYETLDSGERAEYASGMVRDTEDGKERFDLIYPLDIPYDRQLAVRAEAVAQRDEWELGKDNAEEITDLLHTGAIEAIQRWILQDEEKDWAAEAFADMVGLAETAWSVHMNDFSFAPYGEAPMTRLAALMSRGIEKYGARNWEKGNSEEELRRAYSSAMRHHQKYCRGLADEDHLAGTMFNLLSGDYYEQKLKVGHWRDNYRVISLQGVEVNGISLPPSTLVDVDMTVRLDEDFSLFKPFGVVDQSDHATRERGQ